MRRNSGRNTAGGRYRTGCLVPLIILPLVGLALLIMSGLARAAVSTSINVQITITNPGPLVFTVNPNPAAGLCEAKPGDVIAAIAPSGGTGAPIAWSVLPARSFAVSGLNLVVGPNGIANSYVQNVNTGDCGKTDNLVVTATQ